jgi:hypothetical protein
MKTYNHEASQNLFQRQKFFPANNAPAFCIGHMFSYDQ